MFRIESDRGRSSAKTCPADRALFTTLVGLLCAVVLAAVIYPNLRYGGRWGETDTAVFTQAIGAIAAAGRLLLPENIYPNGYGYQSLVLFLSALGGVPVTQLQIYGASLFFLWLVIPAWLLYRELTGSELGGVLASIVLFIQPEFLFPTLRGTHEKFTRGLMLLCLFLLVRSLRERESARRFAGFVIAFYLCIYAVISFNNLFATSFIASVGLALLLIALFAQRSGSLTQNRALLQRLCYVIVSSLVVAIIFTFYAYPPASHSVRILQSVWDRIAVLLLDINARSFNPYSTVQTAWINLPTYFAVSLANWMLLGASALLWFHQSWRWWRGRWQPDSLHALTLWSFYGAFAFLGALSVLVDFSGAIAGNLQHRIFPSFAMLAAPVVTVWLLSWRPLSLGQTWRSRALLSAIVAIFAVLALFKATNEPLLSNKWLFFERSELAALEWADAYLPGYTLWSGHDERLSAAFVVQRGAPPANIELVHPPDESTTGAVLVSDVIRRRGLRVDQPQPPVHGSIIAYDNGSVQIYRELFPLPIAP